jgi:hypothetical protein
MDSQRIASCIVATAWLACSGGATTGDPSAPLAAPESVVDARTVLQRMQERYRSARTYRDESTYRSVSRGANGDVVATVTARLRTRWSAPDLLRFELHEEPSKFFPARSLVIWTPRSGVTMSWFLEEERFESSLDDALGSLQGVSHGTTGLVPRWLSDGGCKCSAQYELRGTTRCGHATCFELAGTLTSARRATLYVDTSSHALRRVVWTSTPPLEPIPAKYLDPVPPERREGLRTALEARRAAEIEDVLEIEPTFDGPMDAAAFEFKPPPSSQ